MRASTVIDPAESRERYGERYAHDYDVRRFTTTEGAFAQRFEVELFSRVLREHGARTVLDAPIGTGRMAIPLAGQVAITGADISPVMLASAKARLQEEGIATVTLVECSVDRLPFPDGQFDASVTARLFQHVPKNMAHAIICELSRVVKPGGVLILQFRSGLYGLVLKVLRYYVSKGTGNIRHKCIFPDQLALLFEGHEIIGHYGYKFPASGRLASIFGYEAVARVERVLARTPGIRWLGKYKTFVIRRRTSGHAGR